MSAILVMAAAGLRLIKIALMKRVIKSKATNLYLRIDGTWTSNAGEAADFPNSMAAIQAKALFSLDNVEMILQIGVTPNELYDIVLPLKDFSASAIQSGAA